MEHLTAVRGRMLTALVACCVSLSLAAALAGRAAAYVDPFGGRNLPGHTWSGSGVYAGGLYFTAGEDESTSSVCVAPVVKSGGGWATPYGWACQPTLVTWEYPQLTGMPAVYNPNPGAYAVWRGLAYFR
jgi:hypothetical protein